MIFNNVETPYKYQNLQGVFVCVCEIIPQLILIHVCLNY